MAADERWYFTKEEIRNSPSIKCGIDTEKELSNRQQGAKLIQDMGQRLQVTQLVINTAIVYMHRFYMFHPFTKFHRNSIGPAALFLAAKVEEQPRKLEHVIKVAHYILCHHEHTNLDTQSEAYMEKAQELVMNENILLQTLGFDVAIDHPHTYVVKCFQMVRTTTELAQTSYFMATNSLHMTTMCLQYRPAVVACVCIYIVCKWSNYEIQRFTEGKDWFCHVDPTVTLELLETLTSEFLAVLDKYPNRLKKLMNSGGQSSSSNSIGDDRSSSRHGSSLGLGIRSQSLGTPSSVQRSHDLGKGSMKTSSQPPMSTKTVLSHKEYSEKRDKERRERDKHSVALQSTLSSSSSQNIHSNSGSSSGSSNIVSNSSTSVQHSRSQSAVDPNLRKPHSDNRQQLAPHSLSSRPSLASHPSKDPHNKKELLVMRGNDTKLELDKERTSDISDSAKLPSDRLKSNVDHRHSLSSNELHQLSSSKNLEINKEKRIDVKPEFKTLSNDNRTLDNREIKSHSFSNTSSFINNLDHKVIPKSEQPNVKLKEEKVEVKVESKAHGLEEVKPSNSFIFNNNDFSLRDFLNPSAMPPEDIFDTESDSKLFGEDSDVNRSSISKEDLFSCETTHHKLMSPTEDDPPLSSSQNSNNSNNSTATVKGNSHLSNANPNHDTLNTTPESKSSSKRVSPRTPVAPNQHPTNNTSKISTPVLSTIPSSIPTSSTTSVQSLSIKKKEKSRSPNPVAASQSLSKAKVPNSDSAIWLSSLTKIEEQRQVSDVNKHQILASSESLLSSAPSNTSTPVLSASTLQAKTSTPQKNVHVNVPVKASILEPSKVDSSVLNDRFARPDDVDGHNPSLHGPALAIPVLAQFPVKKHKHEHGRHKHKEKKKHKHKEKDKHRDKDSKEKKAKKHKKHKDKEKEKHHLSKDDSLPLKITLRTKGVYTPESGTSSVHASGLSQVPVKEDSSVSNMNTPARIKLTIPKSRLQVNTPSGSQDSFRDVTPKVKLKIQKDHLRADKDVSRKRDRDDQSLSDSLHPSKMQRSSSNYVNPQVSKSPLLPYPPINHGPRNLLIRAGNHLGHLHAQQPFTRARHPFSHNLHAPQPLSHPHPPQPLSHLQPPKPHTHPQPPQPLSHPHHMPVPHFPATQLCYEPPQPLIHHTLSHTPSYSMHNYTTPSYPNHMRLPYESVPPSSRMMNPDFNRVNLLPSEYFGPGYPPSSLSGMGPPPMMGPPDYSIPTTQYPTIPQQSLSFMPHVPQMLGMPQSQLTPPISASYANVPQSFTTLASRNPLPPLPTGSPPKKPPTPPPE